ncbi:hypothetical protein HPB49_007766 [Dermacentor silvarum]|uniref:Uncharacterized protein n=1 Tax=Dermacentor silvarum TaxID=543639 RepID=A0ACB8DWX6_DERSI|nr:hypothetical protein HPB49_007766 [Dermacentor silvarum]
MRKSWNTYSSDVLKEFLASYNLSWPLDKQRLPASLLDTLVELSLKRDIHVFFQLQPDKDFNGPGFYLLHWDNNIQAIRVHRICVVAHGQLGESAGSETVSGYVAFLVALQLAAAGSDLETLLSGMGEAAATVIRLMACLQVVPNQELSFAVADLFVDCMTKEFVKFFQDLKDEPKSELKSFKEAIYRRMRTEERSVRAEWAEIKQSMECIRKSFEDSNRHEAATVAENSSLKEEYETLRQRLNLLEQGLLEFQTSLVKAEQYLRNKTWKTKGFCRNHMKVFLTS